MRSFVYDRKFYKRKSQKHGCLNKTREMTPPADMSKQRGKKSHRDLKENQKATHRKKVKETKFSAWKRSLIGYPTPNVLQSYTKAQY